MWWCDIYPADCCLHRKGNAREILPDNLYLAPVSDCCKGLFAYISAFIFAIVFAIASSISPSLSLSSSTLSSSSWHTIRASLGCHWLHSETSLSTKNPLTAAEKQKTRRRNWEMKEGFSYQISDLVELCTSFAVIARFSYLTKFKLIFNSATYLPLSAKTVAERNRNRKQQEVEIRRWFWNNPNFFCHLNGEKKAKYSPLYKEIEECFDTGWLWLTMYSSLQSWNLYPSQRKVTSHQVRYTKQSGAKAGWKYVQDGKIGTPSPLVFPKQISLHRKVFVSAIICQDPKLIAGNLVSSRSSN